MFDKNTYQSRRQKLKEQVGHGLILLLGNEDSSMNYKDNYYHFRQDSSFLYFFGLDRPGLGGIIDIDKGREILLGREPSLDEIIWTGYQRPLIEEVAAVGVGETMAPSGIISFLQNTHSSNQPIHFLPPYRPENILKLSAWLGISPNSLREHSSISLIKAIVAQRSVKS